MPNTNNVYSWKVFDSFIRKACNHSSETKSHPVIDEVARDLKTGALQSDPFFFLLFPFCFFGGVVIKGSSRKISSDNP